MNMYNPPHPGEIIKEVLVENNGLSITEAAKLLSVSRITLSKIINGKNGVSAEMAIRLSIALNTSSGMWVNLQTSYELWEAEKNRKKIAKEVKRVENYKRE